MKKSNLFFDWKTWAAIAIVSSAVLFTSCNKDDDDTNDTSLAGVMAFNLVPEGKSVGFVSGSRFITSNPMAFNSYTGTYLGVFPGSQTIGAVNFAGGGTLTSQTFNFETDKYYSIFLVGEDPAYEQVIVEDKLAPLATTTQAFVRYINAIPDASGPTVTVAVNGTNVINEPAVFKAVSEFTAIDPGAVTITVANGGTISATRTITLEKQKVYTILLSGKPGATGDFAVQIRYIENGSVDGTAGRIGSASIKAIN
ncbi:MAG TPA: DUF4397 domain-containing protein [Chitinophagaceae bacterium]|jgi:hypothetical protein|nr:DUF4397 domain-containing protein [Chitinophagaceae bacterium]